MSCSPPVVLVVDDNPTNRRVLEVWLKKCGFAVELAHQGEEALRVLAGGRAIDLILMDCEMPVLNGVDTTRAIRSREADAGGGRRIPIIAVTASPADQMLQACLEAGMDDFQSKPINLPTLLERMRELMGLAPQGA